MKKFKSLITVAFALTVLLTGCTSTKNNSKDIPLQFNQDVLCGQLDNGMSYYILQNANPLNRISLRLAVKVGSIAEAENECGVAHFIEHMCFNGTEHFEKNSLIDYAESIGMDFGAEVNAYTSFEETVYKLEVPADNPDYLEKALLIFHDWASAVTFDPEELDKERGVVLEEWRGRLGLTGRLVDAVLPFELKDSPFVDRLPIGKPEVIQNITRDEVVNFYKKWYQPQNMAVVISGVVDPKVAEWLIKNSMGTIPAAEEKHTLAKGTVPPQTQKDLMVFADPELTFTQVQIISQDEDNKPCVTQGDLRRTYLTNLVNNIFNLRLYEITSDPDSPWLGANSVRYNETNTTAFNGYYFVPKEGCFAQAFQTMLDETDRLLLHGITESEFLRAKESLLTSENQWYEQSPAITSTERVDSLCHYFLCGDIVVSDDDYIEIARSIINSITLDEVNARATDLFEGRGTLCMIYTPESTAAEIPTKEEFISFWENYKSAAELEAYEDNAIDGDIMARPDKKAAVVSTNKIEALKSTEYVLENGARIIIRKNELDKGKIVISGLSNGGSSLVKDSEYPSCIISPLYAFYSGIGGMDISQFQKYISTKALGFNIAVNDTDECISGNSTPDNFEDLLQIINLFMTKPQFTEQGWNFVMQNMQQRALAYNVQPTDVLISRVRELLYGKSIRHTAINPEFVEMLDAAKSERIFKERFGNVSDFSFVISGDVDEEKVLELCQYYIGTIPVDKPLEEEAVHEKYKVISKITNEVVKKGKEDKGLVYICFGGRLPAAADVNETYKDIQLMEQLRSLIEIKLREIIREDKSGTYGVGVYGGIDGYPERNFQIQIEFGCEPAREEELIAEIITALDNLKKEAPAQSDVDKLRETYRRNFETNQNNSDWWVQQLGAILVFKYMPLEAAYDDNFGFKFITADNLKEQANRYLDTTKYICVSLKPEE